MPCGDLGIAETNSDTYWCRSRNRPFEARMNGNLVSRSPRYKCGCERKAFIPSYSRGITHTDSDFSWPEPISLRRYYHGLKGRRTFLKLPKPVDLFTLKCRSPSPALAENVGCNLVYEGRGARKVAAYRFEAISTLLLTWLGVPSSCLSYVPPSPIIPSSSSLEFITTLLRHLRHILILSSTYLARSTRLKPTQCRNRLTISQTFEFQTPATPRHNVSSDRIYLLDWHLS